MDNMDYSMCLPPHFLFYHQYRTHDVQLFSITFTLIILVNYFPFFLQYLATVASHKRYATNMVGNGHVHLLHLPHRRVCMVDMVVAPSENTWPTHI